MVVDLECWKMLLWSGLVLSRLAAAAGAVDALEGVPTVDLKDAAASATLGAALARYGFFYVTNHGIPQSLIDAQFEQSRTLFALPLATKRSMPFEPQWDIGYMDDQALDEESGVKDTKEGFLMTNNVVVTDPTFEIDSSDPLANSRLKLPPLVHYEGVMRRWASALYGLNHRLNSLMFQALGLDDFDRLKIARQPFFVVKQLRYGEPSTPDDNGAGAHADWGALTLLVTDGVPGLEIEVNSTWLPVPPRPGAIIVNAGDQIEFWSNGNFRSANHRVRARQERYSTAFFAYFDYHASIKPVVSFDNATSLVTDLPVADNRHFGLTTGEYFAFKLCESVGKVADTCLAPPLTLSQT